MKAAAAAALLWAVASPAAGPSLRPIDEQGFRKLLEEQHGKVVLVDFWATWCEPCREELPALARMAKELRGRGFVLITISADEPEQEKAASALLRSSGIEGAAFVKRARSDEAFINFIDRGWSGALPALFLYGRNGERAARFIGETDPGEVESAVRKLL